VQPLNIAVISFLIFQVAKHGEPGPRARFFGGASPKLLALEILIYSQSSSN
jgi:hypothetical protein